MPASGRGAGALESRLRETAALLAVARVASSTTDLGEALRLICRELARLTGAETVSAYVRQAEGAPLRPLSAHHVPKHALGVLAASPLTVEDQRGFEALFRGGRVIWTADVPGDPRFAADLFRRFPHQSGLVIPLFLEGQVAGVFYLVWWRERRRFEETDLAPLQAIGEQAGVLLRNARLHDALGARAARLRTLARLTRLVSSSLDPDEVLGGIAGAAAELMQVPVVSVWVADAAAKTIEVRAFSAPGVAADFPLRIVPFGRGGVGWVARHRQPLEAGDVFGDPRFLAHDWWRAHGLSSFLGVPIVFQNALLGVLVLNGQGPFNFDGDARELLDIFVAQSAAAIRNAQAHALAQLHVHRLETLTTLSRVVTAALEPQVILPALADAAVSLFPGAVCRLWTTEGDLLRLRAESGTEAEPARGAADVRSGEGLVGAVAASGRASLIEDLAAGAISPGAERGLADGAASAALLPLVIADRPVGLFGLFTRARRLFTSEETRVLEALAEQAAMGLAKARLFQDIQDRRRLTEDLYALTQELTRSMDLQQRLDTFAAGASRALYFERINVWLAAADGAGLELVAGSDLRPDTPRRIPLAGGGGFQMVWESGQTLIVSTDEELARVPPLPKDLQTHPVLRTRRFALVPLSFQGRPVGVVSADNKTSRRPITRRGVAHLELFCQQLATAVNNARLYGETQQRERDATILLGVTRKLSATLELDQVLDLIADGALAALGCDAAGFYRWDASRGGLAFVRGRNHPRDFPAHLLLRAGEGVVGRAYAERRPVWSQDRPADAGLAYSPDSAAIMQRPDAPRAYLAVPIVIRDEVFGVLGGSYFAPHVFTEREVALLSSLAAQAAVAIENARLYGVTQQSLAGAALLNAAARTLHRTLDVKRLLPDAAATLAQTFGASRAGVVLFEEPGGGAGQVIGWGDWAEETLRALAEPLRRREAPLLIPDTAARDGLIPPGLLEPGGYGLAAFPVRGRSRVLGGLLLLFAAPRALTEAETRLLAAYADQLAMALDNAALFEEAANQKTRLEQVFASTSDGFLVLDLDQRVAALNQQGGDLLGVDPHDVIGRPFQRLVEMLDRSVAWETSGGQTLAAALEIPGEPATGDLEVRLPERRTLRWHSTPTRDLLGTAVGLTMTLRDVTREREIDRMKTEFVSTVSHELRTPLASIKGSLHLLLSDPNLLLDETQRHLVDISLKNTDRLIRLINNILDISKIEAGRIHLELDTHRPADFIGAAVDGIQGFAESRSITLDRQVAADVPALRVDVDRMVQVVTNLLSNAIKFSPDGGRVTVGARRTGDEVEIWVSDQGPGIAPEDVSRLFRKFQQLDGSTVRAVGGTGLGLAICHGIVEEHGGGIGVESRPGAGATFTVRLPVPQATATAARAGGTGGPAEEAPLVLVVDDEPDVRALLRDQLELAGMRVLEAGRVLEAVELARQRRPDVITMDLMLPDLDGFEAIRLLREQSETRETPVVVLSAIEVETGDPRALGATVCLTKPFASAVLLNAIRSSLRPRKGVSP